MSAKMKTLEEQHQDYQRHIAVLKESLCAKEEHYNMLQADVSISTHSHSQLVPVCKLGALLHSAGRHEYRLLQSSCIWYLFICSKYSLNIPVDIFSHCNIHFECICLFCHLWYILYPPHPLFKHHNRIK
jgi:hypothetical protein